MAGIEDNFDFQNDRQDKFVALLFVSARPAQAEPDYRDPHRLYSIFK